MFTSLSPVVIEYAKRKHYESPVCYKQPNYRNTNETDRIIEVLMTKFKVTHNKDESNHDQLLSSFNQDNYEESTMSNPKVTEDQDEKQPTASSTFSVTNFGGIDYNSSQDYGENSGNFDIRQFTSALEESHKPGKYICPACQGANLSIDKNSGAYNCWNDDSAEHRKEIRNKLSPPKKPSSAQSQLKLASVEQIATIDEPTPVETHINKSDESSETLYPYTADESLQVLRKDFYEDIHDKDTGEVVERKKEKSVRPYYTDSEGNVKCGSKNIDFPPYRMDEALTHGADKYVVFVEGEKTVESLRMKGIIAITLQGSKWDAEDMTRRLTRLKHEGQVKGVIVFPDHDEAGDKKARKVIKAANQVGMHSLLVSPKKVWADIPEKGDASDWLDEVQPDRRAALKALMNASYEASENGSTKTKEQLKLENQTRSGGIGQYKSIEEARMDPPYDGRLVADPDKSIERCMAEYISDDWLTETDEFYRYTGKGYYEQLKDSRVRQEISRRLREVWVIKSETVGEETVYYWVITGKKDTESNIKSCFEYAQSVLTDNREFDNTKFICFRNTTVNVETKEDVGHSKENHILTPPLAGDYIPDAECPPVFHAFLKQSYGEHMIPLIRAFTSLLLDPTAPFGNHTVPHLQGQSGSGKGTLLRVWTEMMGESSAQIFDFGILGNPDKVKQYVDGKRLLINPDASGMQLNMQAFYEMVDNGRISVRKLYSSSSESKKLYCRFALASVSPLQFENAGEGAARRITTIPTRTPDENFVYDPYLEDKFDRELSQIVSWAISMNRYERDRWVMTAGEVPEVAEAKQSARISGDSVRSFIDESLRHSSKENSYISKDLLYSAYKVHCAWSGVKPLGKNKFWHHLNSFCSSRLASRSTTTVNGSKGHIPPRFLNAKWTHPSLYTAGQGYSPDCDIAPQHLMPGGLEHLGLQ
jgi:5S rRNA maturation endonuclease (ribonuclease M5)